METPTDTKPLTKEQEAVYDAVIAEILYLLEHSDQDSDASE